MNTVTVSSKFQVVIPKEIREDIGLRAGTTMEIIIPFCNQDDYNVSSFCANYCS